MTTKIDIIPLPGALGAEMKCGDVRELDEKDNEFLNQAWFDHLVLLFRDQQLSDPELIAFGSRFGKLQIGAPTQYQKTRVRELVDEPSNPQVRVVSNVKNEEGQDIGVLGDGECAWHSDASFSDIPYAASILHSLEIPDSWGGDTGFLNMYAALDTLPQALRDQIEGRTIKCDNTRHQRRHDPSRGARDNRCFAIPGSGPPHRPHPSGDKIQRALSRPPAALIHQRLFRRRVRTTFGYVVRARGPRKIYVGSSMAGRRDRDLGQSLRHASSRSVRSEHAASHASGPDHRHQAVFCPG